jgi:hypothetical protein
MKEVKNTFSALPYMQNCVLDLRNVKVLRVQHNLELFSCWRRPVRLHTKQDVFDYFTAG